MSRVFVATDVGLARKVVVKVLPPELAAGVNHERFRREIQVAAQLQHPQPAEGVSEMMPRIVEALREMGPRAFSEPRPPRP